LEVKMFGCRFPLSPRRAIIALGLSALLGCTDTVFRDREPFNPPIDTKAGLLGYFTVSTKQTTCGNCHTEKQADWVQTKHASAYADLIGSNHAQSSCYSCHTVSANGNLATAPAGWDAKQDSVYYDVQCESCHGPGFTHVQAPSLENIPLAHEAILANPASATDNTAKKESCGSCHSGIHTPFEEEWAQSGHGRPLREDDGTFVADVSPTCGSCHEGHKILEAWNVVTNYAERDSAGSEHYFGITCPVCHDPHGTAKGADGKPLPGQLRFPIDVADPNINLCMKCHQRRSVPDQASSRGPHAPQGPLLLGDAGYHPQGLDPDVVQPTSHGSSANPRLCAGCHVNGFTVTDKETGAFTFQSVGHLFRPTPCLDASGKPVADNTCPHTTTARSWAACAASGCHNTAANAVTAFRDDSTSLDQLTKTIWDDKNGNDKVDASPTDGGLLSDQTSIPTTEYQTNDNNVTPAEGAVFNVRMLRTVNGGDKSYGVHNPFLAKALLRANVVELHDVYGVPLPPGFSITSLLNDPLGPGRPLSRPLIDPAVRRRR
jgi:Cytochrome c554 and c-prime